MKRARDREESRCLGRTLSLSRGPPCFDRLNERINLQCRIGRQIKIEGSDVAHYSVATIVPFSHVLVPFRTPLKSLHVFKVHRATIALLDGSYFYS